MISSNKKLRIIRCNESELTEENSKYPVTEGYVYICEDTENVYFDDSDNKRHLVNGKSLDGSTTFIINELIKQNIEYKNLLNSINATQSSASPQNKEREIQFNSVSDLLNNSTILDYSSNNFSEIPCITIKSVNVREDWAKPYYRYATIEDAGKTSAKLVFKFDESIANENNRGPLNIDVEYTLSDSQTTTDIYSSGAGITINKNDKSISLSDSGVTANTYGPSADVTGTNNSTILIPKITVDRYGRVTDVANITYTSKDTTYAAATQRAPGLMSAADKVKLDGIAAGAQVNAVTSVAGKTGAVTLAKGDVGLGNVDNTADSVKSVYYAGNAGKVNNHTVNADVPSGAKFTDTTYGVADTSTNGLMSKRIAKYIEESDKTWNGYIDTISIGGWLCTDGKFYCGWVEGDTDTSVPGYGACMQSYWSTGTYIFAAGSTSHSNTDDTAKKGKEYFGSCTGYSKAPFRVDMFGETWIDNGHGTISASSDRKLKDHIEYLSDDDKLEEFFNNLKPIMFTYKDAKSKRHHMGFYAQDVSENAKSTIGDIAACKANIFKEVDKPDAKYIEEYFDPNADDEDLRWYLDYIEFIAPTVAVVQKQSAKIKELENTVEELKSVVGQLKSLLE